MREQAWTTLRSRLTLSNDASFLQGRRSQLSEDGIIMQQLNWLIRPSPLFLFHTTDSNSKQALKNAIRTYTLVISIPDGDTPDTNSSASKAQDTAQARIRSSLFHRSPHSFKESQSVLSAVRILDLIDEPTGLRDHYADYKPLLSGALVSSETSCRSQPKWGLWFDSSLSRRLTTEPLLLLAFLFFVFKLGKRISALGRVDFA